MTMAKAAPSADEVNHLWPSMTYSSPSSDSRRAHPQRIRAGVLRFGHRETTAHTAANEGRQEALLLGGRAVQVQDLHVADVGRLAIEEIVAKRAAAERLAHVAEFHQRQAHSAQFFGQMGRPQAKRLDPGALLCQRWQQFASTHLAEVILKRVDLLFHKRPDLWQKRSNARSTKWVHETLLLKRKEICSNIGRGAPPCHLFQLIQSMATRRYTSLS